MAACYRATVPMKNRRRALEEQPDPRKAVNDFLSHIAQTLTVARKALDAIKPDELAFNHEYTELPHGTEKRLAKARMLKAWSDAFAECRRESE